MLDKELDAARRAGFGNRVEKLDHLALPGGDPGPCLRFGGQARFHPMKYLAGLARAAEKRGVRIFTGRRVKDVQGSDARKNEKARATLDDDADGVSADAIVVATNTPAPISDWMGIYVKQAAYRTYVVGLKMPAGFQLDGLYWDTADPYHYVRTESRQDGEVLLVGGEDHKTGQFPADTSPFLALDAWARKWFPAAGETVYRWSGQVQEPADGMAYIGKAPTARDNVFVVTGDSGMGLTHGSMAGLILSDLILERPNPWAEIYDPSRKTLSGKLVRESANAARQYVDLLTGGDVKSAEDVKPGQGAVIRQGLHKLAVYRDEAGGLHQCSAICTHLQCVVQWNQVEGTWDCPCHGSRFDPIGKVIMGPAIDDLEKIDPK